MYAILIGLDRYLLHGKDAAMADKDTDLQKIKKLIKIMKENELVEIEIKHGDNKIALKRAQPQPAAGGTITAVPVIGHEPQVVLAHSPAQESPATSAKALPDQQEEGLVEIKSPIVGTFYATASPDSELYVELGSHVNTQTVVCIIEAMKVMNEIKAETSGIITEVLVSNGQAVEYGQVLFRVRPD
jgi:acetyl-CoA carboxylase biotin carboxyl carrier protein